jgi:hypothetical protein
LVAKPHFSSNDSFLKQMKQSWIMLIKIFLGSTNMLSFKLKMPQMIGGSTEVMILKSL